MRLSSIHAAIVPIALAMTFPAFAADAPETGTTLESADRLLAVGALPEAGREYAAFAHDSPTDPQAPRAFADAVIMNSRLDRVDIGIAESDLRHFEHSFVPVNVEIWAEMAFTLIDGFVNREHYRDAMTLLHRTIAVQDQLAADAQKKKTHDLQTLREIEVRARGRMARIYTEMGNHRGAAMEHAHIQKLISELGVWPGKKPPRAAAKYPEMIEFIAESFFYVAEQKRFEAEQLHLPAYTGKGDRDSILAYRNGPAENWIKYRQFAMKEADRLYAFVLGLEWKKPELPKLPPHGDPNAPVMYEDEDPFSPNYAGPPSPRWAIAAVERDGRLHSDFVREFHLMPIPKEWSPSSLIPNANIAYAELRIEFTHDFWGESPAYTQKQQAKHAYELCLDLSTKHQIVNEHTRACSSWLSKNYGMEYHDAEEFAPPGEFFSLGIVTRPAPLPRFTH